MGKTRIVLDTNVLISAFGWGGKPREVFEKVVDGYFELIICEKQFAEIQRVLDYPRLKLDNEYKVRILDVLSLVGHIVETHNHLNVIKEDPSDNILLESAVEYNAAYIISGDNHLLKIKEFNGIKIITPAEFLNVCKQQS